MNKIVTYPDVVVKKNFGELLVLLHQGGREKFPWDSFLKLLCLFAECDVAAIVFESQKSNAAPVAFWSSRVAPSQQQMEDYKKAQAELEYFDPLLETLARTGGVLTIDQTMPRDALKSSQHYLNLMKPFGLEHAIAVSVDGIEGFKVFLTLFRGPDKKNFGNTDKDLLVELQSHFIIALNNKFAIEKFELEKQIYSDALSKFAAGTVLLDRNLRVIDISSAAKSILSRASCISINDGQLVVSKVKYREEFNRYVAAALRWREIGTTHVLSEAFRIECSTGEDVGVVVSSIQFSGNRDLNAPCVAIHLEELERGGMVTQEGVIGRLFRLTKSEARLAVMLANGFTLSEAATKLNLTESSVRTYSKKIFAKMGVSRQAELVRLITRSIANLAGN